MLNIFRNTRYALFANVNLKLLKSIQVGSILVPSRIDIQHKGILSIAAEGLTGSRGGTDTAIDCDLDDGFRYLEDVILISNVVGIC